MQIAWTILLYGGTDRAWAGTGSQGIPGEPAWVQIASGKFSIHRASCAQQGRGWIHSLMNSGWNDPCIVKPRGKSIKNEESMVPSLLLTRNRTKL